MALQEDIALLRQQEERLVFTKFDEADAWALGNRMRNLAIARTLPFVIDIRVAGRKLFYTALPGTSPDHEDWVQRKIKVVMRLHKSSYRVGRELLLKGKTLDESEGVLPINFAPHGGCFPITIKNVGVVGTITVSGVPQREDHNFVVECLAASLGMALADLALPAETN